MANLNLKSDKSFVALLMAERAAMLARVDAIEKFLEMPRTKDLRKAAKQERRAENETLAGYHVQSE